jgi:uncharacterized protein (DUF169 family)
MTLFAEYHRCGKELEQYLLLKTSPLAIKMLQKEADIPAEAIRPKRDRGQHLAQCQAFALSRRQGLTVAMLKEDNWCWGPLIAYGLIDPAISENYPAINNQVKILPCFEQGKYIGIVSAPLKKAGFKPDVVLIYSNTAQVRNILMVVKDHEKALVSSIFDPIDSCIYSVVPVMLTGQYRITLPDPGEFQRALAGEDEIIFSVPGEKIQDLAFGLGEFDRLGRGYSRPNLEMRPDFPQPEFYRQLFKACGLDTPDELPPAANMRK